jgi:hypothetical protein
MKYLVVTFSFIEHLHSEATMLETHVALFAPHIRNVSFLMNLDEVGVTDEAFKDTVVGVGHWIPPGS